MSSAEDKVEKNIEPATESVADGSSKNFDKAYQFAKEHHAGPLSPEEDRRLRRKIDFHLLPLVRSILSIFGCLLVEKACN